MRLKDYDERDGKRVWLSEQEISLLLDRTDNNHPEMDIAFQLMARCGLRRDEATDVTPADLVTNDTGQIVRVWEGKGDDYREVPAPSKLTELALGMGRDPDSPFVSVDPSTLWDWVARARDRCRAHSGDEGWRFVGPHDLRRTWGVRLLEAGVLPSVVMDWGGWDDWQTFRNHYLAEFSPEALRHERGKVGWLAEYRTQGGATDANPGYSVVNTGQQNW